MQRRNGIDGQLPVPQRILAGDDLFGKVQFPNRALMKVKMTVLPYLNKDGALALISYNQYIPTGLLFISTEHRLRIAHDITRVLRMLIQKVHPTVYAFVSFFTNTVSFCQILTPLTRT